MARSQDKTIGFVALFFVVTGAVALGTSIVARGVDGMPTDADYGHVFEGPQVDEAPSAPPAPGDATESQAQASSDARP
jgi:hypothetical protein